MTDFRLPRPVDAAICMQDSQGHLLETAELVAHLRAVRRNLRPGGLYVFDRMVPNGWRPGARWTWTRRRRGITVRTTFQTLLEYDVARQVCQEVMRFEITERGRRRRAGRRLGVLRLVLELQPAAPPREERRRARDDRRPAGDLGRQSRGQALALVFPRPSGSCAQGELETKVWA
jgi:hypothetical protein